MRGRVARIENRQLFEGVACLGKKGLNEMLAVFTPAIGPDRKTDRRTDSFEVLAIDNPRKLEKQTKTKREGIQGWPQVASLSEK